MKRHFMEMLRQRWSDGLRVCVGLDSDYAKIPGAFKDGNVTQAIFAFNAKIITRTMHAVCAYKPNFGFYLAKGIPGLIALQDTIRFIQHEAPGIPVILDAKVGDIGNTNDQYALGLFDEFHADAITVSPYLGVAELEPFTRREEKGIFILCRTSNSKAAAIQNLNVQRSNMALYEVVADEILKHNARGNCGLVVGATQPGELATVRSMVGEMPILIPGLGAQGGDVEATVKAGRTPNGDGMVINASRTIIFSDDPGSETDRMNDQILSFLS